MKEILTFDPEYEGWVRRYVPHGRHYWLHHHDEVEINLVIHGTARYLVGERRYDLSRHTQVWLFPAQDHLLIDLSPDYEMWMAVIRRDLIECVCTTAATGTLADADPPGLFSKRLTDGRALRLATLYEELAGLTGDAQRFNAGLAYLLLSSWADHLATTEPARGRNVHPAVERAAYLLRDGIEPVGLDELAAHVGLSPSRLSRLFKVQMGVPLVRYRNRQCLERFLRLYDDGEKLTMTTAMLEAGFGSYPHFYRVFRETLGHGPAEYRRRLHERPCRNHG